MSQISLDHKFNLLTTEISSVNLIRNSSLPMKDVTYHNQNLYMLEFTWSRSEQ